MVDKHTPCTRCAESTWIKDIHPPSVCFANIYCKTNKEGLLELFIDNNEHFKGLDIDDTTIY
jgi:hypothetical protein